MSAAPVSSQDAGWLDGAGAAISDWWTWLQEGVTSVFDGGDTPEPTRPATPAVTVTATPGGLLLAAALAAGAYLVVKGK